MSQAADADEAAEKRLCEACIGDSYLSAEIKRQNEVSECSYCGKQRPTISISDLAEKCHQVFETYYERTPSEPEGVEAIAHNDPEGGYSWERQGDPAPELISEFAGVGDNPAHDIRLVLEEQHNSFDDWGEEQEYGEEACYTDKDIFAERFYFRWLEFEKSLRTEARLFNKGARELFEDIFAGIAEHPTRGGTSIIVDAGPGTQLTELYRARVFGPGRPVEEALTQPGRNLGPPPASDAKPGRMNARGISVFYGATDPLVALAEVRPPVGSRVVVARFEILRPLKLLAIRALESVYAQGSLFDPDHFHRVERAGFLGRISALMSMPVMPSDDGFDYIVTQAIAEYLANAVKVELDGLLFPSVQTGDNSLNVALFHKASKVQPWIPLGEVQTHSFMSGPDGPEEDYYVREIADPARPESQKSLHRGEIDLLSSTGWMSVPPPWPSI
jgi:RES domain/HEPN/RES N-terminal domain 1